MQLLTHKRWTLTGILATSMTIIVTLLPLATPSTAAPASSKAPAQSGTLATTTADRQPASSTAVSANSRGTAPTITSTPARSGSKSSATPSPTVTAADALTNAIRATTAPQAPRQQQREPWRPTPTKTPTPTATSTPGSTPTSTPTTSTPTALPSSTPSFPTSSPSTPSSMSPTQPTQSNPNAMPTGNLAGWTQTYAQDFTKNAAIGQISAAYGATLLGYNGFNDTSKNGTYAPNQVLSVTNGSLDYYIHSAGGKYLTAAPTPQGYSGQRYGKYTLRFRSDTVPGYKMAFLLWPDSDTWSDGELDFPEGELGGTIGGYAHDVTGNPSRNAFTFETGKTMNDWHTLDIEWTPTRLTYTIDGVSKTTTDRTAIPTKPMHLVLQAETDLNGVKPSSSAAGHIQIDWLTIYKYAP